jgi:voltage-gated potassium channel
MISKNVIIFGYGRFGKTIANSIKENGNDITLAVNDEKEFELASLDGFKVFEFNLESDNSLISLEIEKYDFVVCAMDNNHENLFLALSIRELFATSYIIAISDSIHLTDKFKIAGVNRVIDIYSISGNIIMNILKNPIATKFLQGFINKEHNYIFKEIKIKQNCKLDGKMLSEIDFNRYNIIFIGMIDEELGSQFIFSTVGLNHKLDTHDTLVCVGKQEDLAKFEKECGG